MATSPQYRQDPDAKLKGWHVLLIMLAFFGVMFTVNGFFVYSAVTSFPGEDVEKSYLQGLNYNEKIEARHAQDALGWTMRAGLVGEGSSVLRVEAADEGGAPLSMLEVKATLRRLATTASDTTVTLTPVRGHRGSYEATLPELASGQWDIEIEARSTTSDAAFTAKKVVSVS
ncbi:FixH family protein [Henriciella aquimarina]|uniref:FixH family protein n=1 Tax=Henriciella aquimarina TaxID=545261 RepID=UPI000A06E382|nr:FixH family protein [Henriciella aquimarina]